MQIYIKFTVFGVLPQRVTLSVYGMKPLLVVDNYDSFTFNLVHLLESITEQPVVVCHNDAVPLEDLGTYDRILISPGPGIPEEAGQTLALIRQVPRHIPILGVCLGHQSLAVATGGRLFQLPMVQHGVTTSIQVDIHLDRLKLYQEVPPSFPAGRYHSWMVSETDLPTEWLVHARDEQGRIMSMVHQFFPWQGVQFHPESIMTMYGRQLLGNWLRNC